MRILDEIIFTYTRWAMARTPPIRCKRHPQQQLGPNPGGLSSGSLHIGSLVGKKGVHKEGFLYMGIFEGKEMNGKRNNIMLEDA